MVKIFRPNGGFMEKEKKYVGGWWIWILLLLIITVCIFTGLRYLGVFGKTVVERKVFEQSYQKKEADKTASTTYSAQLAQLRGKLNNPDLSDGTRAEIQSQIDAINILKASKGD